MPALHDTVLNNNLYILHRCMRNKWLEDLFCHREILGNGLIPVAAHKCSDRFNAQECCSINTAHHMLIDLSPFFQIWVQVVVIEGDR